MVLENMMLARIALLGCIGLGMIPSSEASMSFSEVTPENDKSLGTVGLDSSSFFYKSDARGTAATTLNASIHDKFEGSIVRGSGDLFVNTFVTDNPQAVFDAHEAYVSNQEGTLGNHNISVGRKYYEWSKVDEQWKMMSLWSPRNTWDELHPDTIGMTGIFYSYETPRLKFLAFGSPIAIPEQGTPISEKDGKLISPNPLFKSPPSQLPVNGTNTNINYSLVMPPMQDILLRPNFALRARYDFESGAWFSLNSGVLPIHMVQMSAQPYVATQTGQLQVNIIPQFPMRNINTAEVGFDNPSKDWNIWLSASYEQPFNFENQPTWLSPLITPTSLFSAGTRVQLTSNFWFEGSALFIHEQPYTNPGALTGIKVDLPSRFPLQQGIKVGGKWVFNDYTQSNISWVQDLIEQNHLITIDVQHKVHGMPITLGAGADVILTSSTEGWVGQYYGDDRLRGWLKYAF